jgi:hypothetical protein
MTKAIDPSRSLVISVGLESYPRYGASMDLPGATDEAGRFARWATECGVPQARVWLACSPSVELAAPLEGVRAFGTTLGDLQDMFVEASELEGELLLLYWCGHGVLNEKRQRAMFTSDAYSGMPRNFVLDELLDYLSSEAFESFDNQIILIDACANYVQDLKLDEDLPRGIMPSGKPRQVAQFALYAAAQGQFAEHNRVARQTTFSTTVLNWLEAESASALPPDCDKLVKHVDKAFELLNTRGDTRQTPVTRILHSYRGEDDVQRFGGGMPVAGATQKVLSSSGVSVAQMRRVARAVLSLAPLTRPEVRSELVRALIGDADPGSVGDLGLQDLVARVLAEDRAEALFQALSSHASNDAERLGVTSMRTVWARQKLIAPFLAAFSTATSQQVREAFYSAVPELPDTLPTDLDDAMDRAAQYGSDSEGHLALHSLVAFLEIATHSHVPDRLFEQELTTNRLQQLRARVAAVSPEPSRLVVEISNGGVSPATFSWPGQVTRHLYVANRGWQPPSVIACSATLGGVQSAVQESLLEMAQQGIADYTIGFIAPRAAFDEMPELWSALHSDFADPEPLWHDRITMLHSAERRSEAGVTAKWERKAEEIKTHQVEHAPDLAWIAASQREDPSSIRDAIKIPEFPCYGFEFVVGNAPKDLRRDPIIATVVGGAPYVFWMRQEPADWTEAKQRLGALVEHGPFDEIPLRLHQMRLADKSGLGDIVRLVWDHPDVVPPIPQLLGMTERN